MHNCKRQEVYKVIICSVNMVIDSPYPVSGSLQGHYIISVSVLKNIGWYEVRPTEG